MEEKIKVLVQIPEDLDFSALKLARDPVTLYISFDWAPIERICTESGLDIRLLREQHEDNVAGLIVAWYMEHRARGGATDPVEEQILAEVQAEDALGIINVQPGPSRAQ